MKGDLSRRRSLGQRRAGSPVCRAIERIDQALTRAEYSDVSDGGAPGIRRRQARWLTVGLTVTAIGLSACSSDDPDDRGTTSVPDVTTAVPEVDSPSPVDPVNGEPILIETHLKDISAGQVLPGSFIGDSPFCPGGRVRAEHGNPDVGLVHSTFLCRGGQLSIGFSPMQRSSIQSSSWRVVDGRGRYEGARGQGWMVARFDEASGEGRETFTGTVSREPGAS